jgi:hypothetical protein
MSTDLDDEFRRKVRMFGHCWLLVFQGRMFGLRALGPTYWVAMVSHRLLRYGSGLLHLILLATSIWLAITDGGIYTVLLVLQALLVLLAIGGALLRGRFRLLAVAEYYVLVSAATLISLFEVATRGVPAVWDKAEGTR